MRVSVCGKTNGRTRGQLLLLRAVRDCNRCPAKRGISILLVGELVEWNSPGKKKSRIDSTGSSLVSSTHEMIMDSIDF